MSPRSRALPVDSWKVYPRRRPSGEAEIKAATVVLIITFRRAVRSRTSLDDEHAPGSSEPAGHSTSQTVRNHRASEFTTRRDESLEVCGNDRAARIALALAEDENLDRPINDGLHCA